MVLVASRRREQMGTSRSGGQSVAQRTELALTQALYAFHYKSKALSTPVFDYIMVYTRSNDTGPRTNQIDNLS